MDCEDGLEQKSKLGIFDLRALLQILLRPHGPEVGKPSAATPPLLFIGKKDALRLRCLPLLLSLAVKLTKSFCVFLAVFFLVGGNLFFIGLVAGFDFVGTLLTIFDPGGFRAILAALRLLPLSAFGDRVEVIG